MNVKWSDDSEVPYLRHIVVWCVTAEVPVWDYPVLILVLFQRLVLWLKQMNDPLYSLASCSVKMDTIYTVFS